MNTMTTPTLKRDPWSWIPTLYFAEGLPYVAVMTIAVIMYKRLGLSNTEIALYTSWLYLPWTIKPLWSPFVDLIKTKRAWIIAMQGFISAGFAGIAFFIPTTHYVQLTLAFFWLLAFSYIYYASSGMKYLVFLLYTTVVTYGIARMIYGADQKFAKQKEKIKTYGVITKKEIK